VWILDTQELAGRWNLKNGMNYNPKVYTAQAIRLKVYRQSHVPRSGDRNESRHRLVLYPELVTCVILELC
jgi:hypothetical protein